MMQLDRAGREYAHYGLGDLPPSPTTPQVYLLGAWHDAEWWAAPTDPMWLAVAGALKVTTEQTAAGTARIARILLAGPDATANPVGTVVLPAGSYRDRVRFTDSPQIPVRPGGGIKVA